jgi:glycosyltransferase involved in cell wall biosynthesis
VRVLIDYRAALREPSGVGEYAHELSRALLHAGHASANGTPIDVTLFSSSWKDRFVPAADLASASVVDRRVPVRVLNFAWHRLHWPSAEALTRRSFDVVHSLHPLLMPARHAAQVVTIHDLNFLAYPERTRAEIRRDYPALAREHARRADHVIVNSPFTAREVQRLFDLPPERVSIVCPGRPPWARRERMPQPGYLLFFGTLEPRKNIGALLDAYEQIVSRRPDFPALVLAGRAVEAAAPWLARIGRAPLAGRVQHIGYVTPSGRRAVYEGARVLIHPAFEEGFGLTVLEAMTMGVPIVASDCGALPELVGDSGLLVHPQPDALASAIERLVDDDALATRCAEAASARAARFSWDAAADATLAAYRAAMARRSLGRGAA